MCLLHSHPRNAALSSKCPTTKHPQPQQQPQPRPATASLVNINVALELDDAGSELAALILSVVGAAVAATFVSLIFTNQVTKRMVHVVPAVFVCGRSYLVCGDPGGAQSHALSCLCWACFPVVVADSAYGGRPPKSQPAPWSVFLFSASYASRSPPTEGRQGRERRPARNELLLCKACRELGASHLGMISGVEPAVPHKNQGVIYVCCHLNAAQVLRYPMCESVNLPVVFRNAHLHGNPRKDKTTTPLARLRTARLPPTPTMPSLTPLLSHNPLPPFFGAMSACPAVPFGHRVGDRRNRLQDRLPARKTGSRHLGWNRRRAAGAMGGPALRRRGRSHRRREGEEPIRVGDGGEAPPRPYRP